MSRSVRRGDSTVPAATGAESRGTGTRIGREATGRTQSRPIRRLNAETIPLVLAWLASQDIAAARACASLSLMAGSNDPNSQAYRNLQYWRNALQYNRMLQSQLVERLKGLNRNLPAANVPSAADADVPPDSVNVN